MELDLGWSMISPIQVGTEGSWVGAGVGTWVPAGYLQNIGTWGFAEMPHQFGIWACVGAGIGSWGPNWVSLVDLIC